MEFTTTLLTILTPLFAVPLTVIVFYLRSLREQHQGWQSDMVRRVEAVESRVDAADRRAESILREATTRDEWVRECMYLRNQIQRVSCAVTRIETAGEARDGKAKAPPQEPTAPEDT